VRLVGPDKVVAVPEVHPCIVVEVVLCASGVNHGHYHLQHYCWLGGLDQWSDVGSVLGVCGWWVHLLIAPVGGWRR
jgi:hypothetical protein